MSAVVFYARMSSKLLDRWDSFKSVKKSQSLLTKGSAVKAVQQTLVSVYYYPDKCAKNSGIDGYYGPKAKEALPKALK
ncbi:peptidoglycan-binding domain-containing protein [Bacillus pumilus]|uniref:peptidoglycan-binding domain-containing protein n=1 Tax=Bacillus pumilus TaxID=1408 RepID=UPI0037038309